MQSELSFKNSAKLIQQTDGQWQTSRNTAEDIDAVNDLVVSQEGAHETVASQQSWPQTCGLQDMVSAAGMHFIRSQWRFDELKQRLLEAWSGIQQSVIDQ